MRSHVAIEWLCLHLLLALPVMEAFVPLPSREYSLKASVLASADELVETRAVELENLQGLNKCQSGTEARALLESVLNSENSLYNSLRIMPGASEKGISDADLAIQTKIRNNRYSIMELIELNGDKDADRASLSLLCLLVASTISAMVANQIFPGPEIVRFALVWALCFAPLGFVGYGIATPEKLQALLVSMQREVFPVYRKRMIQHEAGHLLMGHLLGLPVKGYTSNAVKNAVEFYPLNDPDVGRVRAQQLGFDNTLIPRTEDNTESKSARQETFPFFSNEGRGASLLEDQSVFRKSKNYRENPFLKLPSLNEPKYSWPFRGFDDLSIDKLTVVSVAGVCAEILAFGNAEGGYADLSQLQQIFNSAQSDLTERDKENRVRWALGYTVSQLRLHLGALDDLADAMERGSTLAECIYAIESCKNVAGGDGVMGEYDRRRREKFRHEGVGLLEKIFLGGKNADTEESRLIRGKGGGDKRQSFVLSGDDPFYAALGVALVFCLWACNGGLTLH